MNSAFEQTKEAIQNLFSEEAGQIAEANRAAGEARARREEARAALAVAESAVANLRTALQPLEGEMSRAQLAGDNAKIKHLRSRYAELTAALEEAEDALTRAEREFVEADEPDSLISSRRITEVDRVMKSAQEQRAKLHSLLDEVYEAKISPDPRKQAEALERAASYR
jgi:chromosome segregation ATPase